ncbi:hypothetical protein BB558_006291 [Smittium angustum]|uniref:HTH APSES-type domain-containing protein n=1 Tax=Smittium angustum TaxID=133377 RepID=A0A2U1IY52_SMIAN|nr:hypothetical protein BB558_006291 [Smittium angustum]
MSDLASNHVYSAVYSGVPVYEMICRGVAVMRRRMDSWLNATQILKVAGIDKGRRTKILEREVLGSKHEKVQGGYGKYQGTWVPFERGVQLCEQYGVMPYLKPIIEHDANLNASGVDQTPTKAELKQKMIMEQKSIAKRVIASSNKKRKDASYSDMDPPTIAPINTKKNKDIGIPDHRREKSINTPGFTQNILPNNIPAKQLNQNPGFNFSPRVLSHHINNQNFNQSPFNPNQTPRTDPNAYLVPAITPATSTTMVSSYNSPHHTKKIEPNEVPHKDKKILTGIFMHDDPGHVPNWLKNYKSDGNPPETPKDLNIPIDDEGHTAVHWAAALARIEALDLLLNGGADARMLNYEGESSLMKAVQVTNNHENQSFHELLELLHDAIPLTDKKNRSVLHHIVLTAFIERRREASSYYMECLLGWISRLSGGFVVDGTSVKQNENTPALASKNGKIAYSNEPNKNPYTDVGNNNSANEAQFSPSFTSTSDQNDSNGASNNFGSNSTFSDFPQNGNNGFSKSTLNIGSQIGFLTPQSKPPQSSSLTIYSEDTKAYKKSDISIIRNADFLAFLDLKDINGDTALSIAARLNDRRLIQLLLSAGASVSVRNRAGLKPSDYWASEPAIKGLVRESFVPQEKPGYNPNSSVSTPLNVEPLTSSAPATTQTGLQGYNNDLFMSPTKSSYLRGIQSNRSTYSHPDKLVDFGEQSDYKSSRNLASNFENAFIYDGNINSESYKKNNNSLPNINSLFGKMKKQEGNHHGSADHDSGYDGFDKNNGGNTLTAIRQLMDDLEFEFKTQLDQKHKKLLEIQNQLQTTTIELSNARETVSKMSNEVSKVEIMQDKIKSLEDFINSKTQTPQSAEKDILNSNIYTHLKSQLKKVANEISVESKAFINKLITPNAFSNGNNSGVEFPEFDSDDIYSKAKSVVEFLEKTFSVNNVENSGKPSTQSRLIGVLGEFINIFEKRNKILVDVVEKMKDGTNTEESKLEKRYRKILSEILDLSEESIEKWVSRVSDTATEYKPSLISSKLGDSVHKADKLNSIKLEESTSNFKRGASEKESQADDSVSNRHTISDNQNTS